MKVSKNIYDIFPQAEDEEIIQVIQDFISSRHNITDLEPGEKEKLPNGISVITLKAESGAEKRDILEAHKKLYDIHYTMQGTDTIAYKPVKNCSNILKKYQEEDDYVLYNEKPEKVVEVASGFFCMIPNLYAHAALYEDKGQVAKLVFKVPVS